MSRIVSVWLPAWPIERLRRSGALQPLGKPVALVEKTPHGLHIHAADEAASAAGVRPGQALADVRAALPQIVVRPAEIDRDRRALQGLARWLGRYGPARHVDGSDGAWIDASGVTHLFGGEAALLDDLVGRLARLGLTARASIADTLGAAHALARWGGSAAEAGRAIAPPGAAATRNALADLPVAALRLTPATVQLLHRLGLKRIGALYGLPRVALERRFRDDGGKAGRDAARAGAAAVLHRLDQALGHLAEPRAPLVEPPDTTARLAFAEPLVSDAGIRSALGQLAADLCGKLDAAGLGARRFALALYRSDGTCAQVQIGTSTGCRDSAHVLRLMSERLASLDADLGIDAAVLEARETAPLAAVQTGLAAGSAAPDPAILVDRLANRLGPRRIVRLALAESHIPERATSVLAPSVAQSQPARAPSVARRVEDAPPARCQPARAPSDAHKASGAPSTAGDAANSLRIPRAGWHWATEGANKRRPSLLFAPPEPVAVVAEIPDGAPARLVWRRVARRIVRTQGPERIAPEWWRALALPEERRPATRDYYRLEDTTGAGYWVFRDGLWGDGSAEPRWFLHGVWA